MNHMQPPDKVFFSEATYRLIPGAFTGDAWICHGTEVECRIESDFLAVDVRSPGVSVPRVVLRWDKPLPPETQFLGDHWERGYGDLAWRGFQPERVMPWYFLGYANGRTTGLGVRTGAGAFCFWMADPQGISLWMDLRCGTEGVRLGERTLRAAEIVTGGWDEPPFAAARAFCHLLCPKPRRTSLPVYGGNDWYYSYGQSTPETLVRDSALLSDLAGGTQNRPFSVIDGGWEYRITREGQLPFANELFSDMGRLACDIRTTGCRPGIWTRPLLAYDNIPETWTLPIRSGDIPPRAQILDPSVPEVLERIKAGIRRLTGWGYDLVKHDFSTYDIMAKWGFEMGAALTTGTWKFHDETRTTAEIIRGLYQVIRQGAGETILIGCNTVGHLGAGLFELQRTGDDTSGRNWERTRRMGINTLAFRMPQQGTFFGADADCVGLTGAIPWELNRQWLSLLAESGTPLFVSAAPEAVHAEQKDALKAAFAMASQPLEPAEPLDWMENTCPQRWKIGGAIRTYDWSGPGGTTPFMMA